MTADEAIAVVRDERERLAIDDELNPAAAERALVAFSSDRERPGPIEHRVAWVVTVSNEWSFVEVHVEDATGKILDVIRSA